MMMRMPQNQRGRVDPVRLEDEADNVVRALERDLPVLSHTPTTMLTGREGATHDVTRVDSSDDDALFTPPGPAAARARPSRRLVLVPESVVATPQSIQDREWEPTVSLVATEVFPMSDDANVEVLLCRVSWHSSINPGPAFRSLDEVGCPFVQ